MSVDNNTTAASQWYGEVFNAGKLELIDELFASNTGATRTCWA